MTTYRRRLWEQFQPPWWASAIGAGAFLIAGITDLLYDWAERGDPFFPYLCVICSGIALYSAIRAKRGTSNDPVPLYVVIPLLLIVFIGMVYSLFR